MEEPFIADLKALLKTNNLDDMVDRRILNYVLKKYQEQRFINRCDVPVLTYYKIDLINVIIK